MKKYLLLCTALTISSSAYAAIDCSVRPSCADLGYTQTETDCAGKFILKCPFDSEAAFCGGEKPAVTCAVGSVVFDDGKCYENNEATSDKTPVGVVFFSGRLTQNGIAAAFTTKLVVSLNDASGPTRWASDQTTTITGLTNYADSASALAVNVGGKSETSAIVAMGGTFASSSYYPGYCYNLTEGGKEAGTWFLPNLSALNALSENRDAVNAGLAAAGGTALSSGIYWSSTQESNVDVWTLNYYDGSFNGYTRSAGYSGSKARCVYSFTTGGVTVTPGLGTGFEIAQ